MAGVVDEVIHMVTTDPACTEKKDTEKKDPDKKDPDHSHSA